MLTSLWLVACGIDPARVPAHPPYARDGAVLEDERVAFALVGATRALVPGGDAVVEQIITDVGGEATARDLDFVVLTGGYVRKSGTAEWAAFDQRWNDVLKSDRYSGSANRIPVLALPGDSERWGDKALAGYGAAFTAQGPDIGLGRVSSWGAFDVKSGARTWRIVWLDPHEEALGSRWQEQLFWLPKVVSSGYDQLLVLLPDARYTAVPGREDDADGDVAELLGVVDEHSPMSSLVGVFTGGPAANAIVLPTGAYGEAHVLAGAAGVPTDSLVRSKGEGDAAIGLEPVFDGILKTQFDADRSELPPRVVEAEGTGVYDGGAFPVQGWWVIEITGGRVLATFRMRVDEAMTDVYAAKWTKKDGWVGGQPAPQTVTP
jgi:hypothetical protein